MADHPGVVTTVQHQKQFEALDEVGVLLDMLDDYESFAQDDEEEEQAEFEWNDIEAVLRRLDRALLVASSGKAATHANITAHLGNIVVDLETHDGERFGEFTAQYELDSAAAHVPRPVRGLLSSQLQESALGKATVGPAGDTGTAVAKEIKTDKREDLFAATPPLEALKILFSLAWNEQFEFQVQEVGLNLSLCVSNQSCTI